MLEAMVAKGWNSLKEPKKFIQVSLLALISLTLIACSPSVKTVEELAARETEDSTSLWNEEDYKTRAAQSCIKYKEISDRALGDLFLNWEEQIRLYYPDFTESVKVLDGDAKFNPISEFVQWNFRNVSTRYMNSIGGNITIEKMPMEALNKTIDLCNELGLDLSED
jgi:hypothetical protein